MTPRPEKEGSDSGTEWKDGFRADELGRRISVGENEMGWGGLYSFYVFWRSFLQNVVIYHLHNCIYLYIKQRLIRINSEDASVLLRSPIAENECGSKELIMYHM